MAKSAQQLNSLSRGALWRGGTRGMDSSIESHESEERSYGYWVSGTQVQVQYSPANSQVGRCAALLEEAQAEAGGLLPSWFVALPRRQPGAENLWVSRPASRSRAGAASSEPPVAPRARARRHALSPAEPEEVAPAADAAENNRPLPLRGHGLRADWCSGHIRGRRGALSRAQRRPAQRRAAPAPSLQRRPSSEASNRQRCTSVSGAPSRPGRPASRQIPGAAGRVWPVAAVRSHRGLKCARARSKQLHPDGKIDNTYRVDANPCNVTITVTKRMKAPVYMYYRITNFFQNHRDYVKSRSDGQLSARLDPTTDKSRDRRARSPPPAGCKRACGARR
eukprot:2317761-Prymnesium_polylepis.1